MTFIKRDLANKILELSQDYACVLLTGPRQVGKTTLLHQLMQQNRNYVTLDDLEERRLAQQEPATLYLVNLKSHKKASKIPFFSTGFSLYQARLYCLAGSVATC